MTLRRAAACLRCLLHFPPPCTQPPPHLSNCSCWKGALVSSLCGSRRQGRRQWCTRVIQYDGEGRKGCAASGSACIKL